MERAAGKEEGGGGTRGVGGGGSSFALMSRFDSGYSEGTRLGECSSSDEEGSVVEEGSGVVLREKEGARRGTEDELLLAENCEHSLSSLFT